jgi:Amt family ammonium transporter
MGGTSLKIISVQLLGMGACFIWVFPTAFILFKLIDKTVGLRVTAEEEIEGLDGAEHGGNAYPDYVVLSTHGGGIPAPAYRLPEAYYAASGETVKTSN